MALARKWAGDVGGAAVDAGGSGSIGGGCRMKYWRIRGDSWAVWYVQPEPYDIPNGNW